MRDAAAGLDRDDRQAAQPDTGLDTFRHCSPVRAFQPEDGDGAAATALRLLCPLLYALVHFSDCKLIVPSRAKNGRFPERHSAKSLRSFGAGEGNRTLVVSLEGFCSTIELHPRASRCVADIASRRPGSNPRRPAFSSPAGLFPARLDDIRPSIALLDCGEAPSKSHPRVAPVLRELLRGSYALARERSCDTAGLSETARGVRRDCAGRGGSSLRHAVQAPCAGPRSAWCRG